MSDSKSSNALRIMLRHPGREPSERFIEGGEAMSTADARHEIAALVDPNPDAAVDSTGQRWPWPGVEIFGRPGGTIAFAVRREGGGYASITDEDMRKTMDLVDFVKSIDAAKAAQ